MEPINRFADLHCHPHMRSFNWLHKNRKSEEKSKYHPWWIVLPKKKPEDKGKRAAAYSQCDMAKVINGNLRLAFLSLYPLEKGWVTGRTEAGIEVAKNLKKLLGNNILNESLSVLVNKFLKFIGDDKQGDLAIRDIIQSIYMKIPLRRVNFVQSNAYDYWNELKEERKFLLKRNGLETRTELFIPFYKRLFVTRKKVLEEHGENLNARGEYEVAKDHSHLQRIINDGRTAFVLTIEGANVFNSHEETDRILVKIRMIKKWKEPVFFITLSHHFNNYLAGHAHSIPDAGNLLLDQSEGITSGITPKGQEVIRYLLSLDGNGQMNEEDLGKRILIDVKHMNAVSRKEYYKDFVVPSLGTEHPIPVIASHVAYSGQKKLQDLIDRMQEEKDGDVTERFDHRFNNWNINMCDEDVINIVRSKGIIGINLDQRVLGVNKTDRNKEETHAGYVWQNIKGMMLAVVNSDVTDISEKERITRTFSLGTDFDGFIDPLNKYPTVMDFEQLAKDLLEVVKNDPDKDKFLYGLDAEVFIEKICFSNAYDFLIENFN